MRIGLVLRNLNESSMKLALQIGVSDIVSGIPGAALADGVYQFQPILAHKKRVEDAGLTWSVIESMPISDTVKLGLDGRDAEIENWIASLRNVGAAGVPIICYNWMAGFGWLRTSFSTRHAAPASVRSAR